MNNLDYAHVNITEVMHILETRWPRPRSEFEQEILDKLLAAALQIHESKDKYATLSQEVRRVQE